MAMAEHIADRFRRAVDSDVFYSFRQSPLTMLAALVTAVFVFAAAFAPWVTPHNPFDLASLDVSNALKPPFWLDGGELQFPFGTDDQGRDVFSTIIFGARISLIVGVLSVILAALIGVALGLVSGYLGGFADGLIMRIADVQLSIPAILIVLMVDAVVRGLVSNERYQQIALIVIVIAIALASWVQYARTVRGSVLVERNKEYVQAARVIGLSPRLIMVRHVLPNVMGPVLVIATINLGIAIIAEATLSFLGVGVPPTTPSLGTLINIGNNFLFSGQWWITLFPGIALAILVLAVNLLGDWLRDALNPKLR
ncbi:MAG TPA: ABC transporter permease [Candidatus Sulfotelmatobacter sp.]|nr:ABC transporter permease [Candidatus Sulfotelmatobacter sp.]